jgi:hypothetical protein
MMYFQAIICVCVHKYFVSLLGERERERERVKNGLAIKIIIIIIILKLTTNHHHHQSKIRGSLSFFLTKNKYIKKKFLFESNRKIL